MTTKNHGEQLRRRLELRRAGGHGKHDSRIRRQRTRATADRAAIKEHR